MFDTISRMVCVRLHSAPVWPGLADLCVSVACDFYESETKQQSGVHVCGSMSACYAFEIIEQQLCVPACIYMAARV